MTFGLYFSPWPAGFSMQTPSGGSLVVKWRKGVLFKSYPRDLAYMKREFLARYPQGRFIDTTTESGWLEALTPADQVVMLYPDSIGLGFRAMEQRILGRVDRTNIAVVTGRRRSFAFSTEAQRALRWRRFLEWTMLPEFGMTAAFLFLTPFLLVVDLAKGKR